MVPKTRPIQTPKKTKNDPKTHGVVVKHAGENTAAKKTKKKCQEVVCPKNHKSKKPVVTFSNSSD